MLLDDFRNAKGEWVRSVKVDGHQLWTVSGSKWKDLMTRCKLGGSEQIKSHTYVGCTNAFESFSTFTDWSITQVGYNQSWQLDKDVLYKKNKVYSENTCVFIPMEINTFLIKCDAARGNCPIGVSWHKRYSKYTAVCRTGRGLGRKHLGYFDCATAAFQAYKVSKEALAKDLAVKWAGKVDPRVVAALNTYEVEITD